MEDDFLQSLNYDDLIDAADDVIVQYLKMMMINNRIAWPGYIFPGVDVFNENPSEAFDSEYPILVFVESRTETCGKTDGCESGCWRVMASDQPIRTEESKKILGFKKILKFCTRKKPREYKRSWVMEEYRLPNKWNWKQDKVICRLKFMFEAEISFWLAKHFPHRYKISTATAFDFHLIFAQESLPNYGVSLSDVQKTDAFYLQTISNSDGVSWPHYCTNDVYQLNPLKLLDLQDGMFISYGICIFANRTDASGITDECDAGCWRVTDNKLIKSTTEETLGFKRILKFFEKEERRYTCEGEQVTVTWTMEEYRLAQEEMQNKVLCLIKVSVDKVTKD